MSVNVRARATSRRKVAFLWLDSISVRAMWGAQSLIGTPGKPAPDPRSATFGGFRGEGTNEHGERDIAPACGNRWRAAKRDSPKWRVTISSGSRIPVRLMREFQRRSISMYVDILESCPGLSGWAWRNGASSSAMRAGVIEFRL